MRRSHLCWHKWKLSLLVVFTKTTAIGHGIIDSRARLILRITNKVWRILPVTVLGDAAALKLALNIIPRFCKWPRWRLPLGDGLVRRLCNHRLGLITGDDWSDNNGHLDDQNHNQRRGISARQTFALCAKDTIGQRDHPRSYLANNSPEAKRGNNQGQQSRQANCNGCRGKFVARNWLYNQEKRK